MTNPTNAPEPRSATEIHGLIAELTVGGSLVLHNDEYDPADVLRAEIANGHRYVMDSAGAPYVRITRWA